MQAAIHIQKLQSLPPESQLSVFKFIDFLFNEAKRSQTAFKIKKRNGFGSWQGIQLSPDFDAPLEDFKEYME